MSELDRDRVGDRVSIMQRGKKGIWTAEFSQDGVHKRRSLRTANKKIALERARKIEVQLVDGTLSAPLPKVAIVDAVADYLRFLETEDRARKTLVKYRGILNTFASFLAVHHATRLQQLTVSLFDRFRAERKQSSQPKTMYTEGVVVKQFVKWARQRKLIVGNPLEDYKLAKPPLVPKAGPSIEQALLILANARDRLAVELAILIFTGMRSGEMQRLRKDDVDFQNNWIHVVSRPGAETKTRRSRKVPIHARLREILARHVSGKGEWFLHAEPSRKYPDGGHCICTKKLNHRFLRLLKKLKLPTGRVNGFTIHSLRHSFETICVNAGIPQRVIDTWLGHTSDKSMAAVYYRLSDEESQKFMERVPIGTGVSAAIAEVKECQS